jgi:hypothetical protein
VVGWCDELRHGSALARWEGSARCRRPLVAAGRECDDKRRERFGCLGLLAEVYVFVYAVYNSRVSGVGNSEVRNVQCSQRIDVVVSWQWQGVYKEASRSLKACRSHREARNM